MKQQESKSVSPRPEHLEEEDIVLLALGEPAVEVQAHVDGCEGCTERLKVARAVLKVDPIVRDGDPERVAALLNRLTAMGAVSPDARLGATISVALAAGQITVLQTDTEVRIRRAVATRSVSPETDLPGVAFFRQLGDLTVEVHLVRSEGQRFHLVVGAGGADGVETGLVFALHRGERQLAVEPAPHGMASFKSLRADNYRLEIRRERATVGFIAIGVESRDREANP